MRYFIDTLTIWDKGNTIVEFKTEADRAKWLAENTVDGFLADGTYVNSFNEMTYDEWRAWRKEKGYE